jgi:hypothetical protein
VDANHMLITKKFEEKVNNLVIQTKEMHPEKEEVNITRRLISKKITMMDSLPKEKCAIERILRGPWFFYCKK